MMYAFPIIPCVVRIILLTTVFTYDTPKFYLLNKEKDEVITTVLEKTFVKEAIPGILSKMKSDMISSGGEIGFKDLFGRLLRPQLIGIFLSIF